MIRLHITPAEGSPFEHELREDSLVVGRASDADLTLSDPFLSRRHSRFSRAGTSVFVEDMGSRNGTLLNGRPILAPTEIRPGDVIAISGSTITVRDGRPPVRSVAPDDFLEDATIFRRAREVLDRQNELVPSDLPRMAERLKVLNAVHQALGRSLQREELLELILDRVFEPLRPDRGAILLKGSDGEFRPSASRSAAGSGAQLPFSRSLVREVTDKGLAALVLDVHADERFSGAASMLLSGVRSLVAAPLLDGEAALGLIVLESRAGVRQFSEADLELLVSLASVAALHLRNLELALEAAERRRLEEELALARRIQVALLPDRLPEAPGWELYAGNVPSRGVSGDYYEVVERAEGRELVFVVADVSGKGMAASLLTASLQAFAAGPIEDGLPPDEISARLSRLLFRRTPPEKYVTACLAVLELATGRLTYTNAGHNPPLLVRAGGTVEELAATGAPLGLLPVASFRAAEVTLAPGDLLVLYTDGIVEAFDPDDEEYGLDRMKQVCLQHRDEPGVSLGAALDLDLERFTRGVPFADDRTVVLVRRSR